MSQRPRKGCLAELMAVKFKPKNQHCTETWRPLVILKRVIMEREGQYQIVVGLGANGR